MDLDLRDRLVVVTGASDGIGRATALALAGEGARLVLGARRTAALEDVAAQAREAGATDVHTVAADLTTPAGVAELTRTVAAGRVHALVTCVGSTPLGTFDELDDDTWLRAFEMKFLATIRAVRAMRPLMGDGSRVVLVGGNAAASPDPWMATSGAMNAALGNLAVSLGKQVGPEGIGVVCVHPGPTRSARLDGLLATVSDRLSTTPENAERWLVDRTSRAALAEPAQIAAHLCWLCSPLAAHLTGTCVTVDGG